MSRVLAIDVGQKRLGLALSDPTRTFGSPHSVINHVSLPVDTEQIAQICSDNQVSLIVVGVPGGDNGEGSPMQRHIAKFIAGLKEQTSIPVLTWDESFSTNQAQQARREMRVPLKKRQGHLDDLAAAIILQSYLDSIGSEKE